MDTGEIVRLYKQAKDPYKQVQILSELTLKPVKEIREILIKEGVYKEMVTWTKEKDAELLQLRSEKVSFLTIAEKFGTTEKAIKNRLYRIKKAQTEAEKIEPVAKPVEPVEIKADTEPQPETPCATNLDLQNELHLKNVKLSALLGLLRITHEDALSGDEKAYYKAADKYEVLIPLLENLADEYDKLIG